MATDVDGASRTRTWLTAAQLAGLASIGAGAIHAAAAGIHAEHPDLSRLFVACAAAQLAVGIVAFARGGRLALAAVALINGGAVVAWVVTRTAGISWIEGLEEAESPQFADTVCAVLGARRRRRAPSSASCASAPRRRRPAGRCRPPRSGSSRSPR